ncbi:MAG: hypothetical protein NVS1B4_04760 [Gemmatimonadaceae bacterium]
MLPTPNTLDSVRKLMEERLRLEGWLQALAAKHESTPRHVYERVHADYTTRLTAVTAELVARKAEVEAALERLSDRLSALQREETALHDERYEAELRAGVGEFAPGAWQTFLRDNDARVSVVAAERGRVSAELVTLRGTLAEVGSRAPEGQKSIPPRASQPPAGSVPGFDELAFLQSVVDNRDHAPRGTAAGPAAAPIITPDGAPAGGSASASQPMITVPTPSGAPGPTPSQTIAVRAVGGPAIDTAAARPPSAQVSGSPDGNGGVPQSPSPAAPLSPASPLSGANQPISEEARAAVETGSVPVFLRGVPREQQRTLKCQACGAFNFSTEWYCEKCGGEMAGV